MKKLVLLATILLGLTAPPTSAATYNWSFDCDTINCSGSGSLETDAAIGPANITSFIGSFGGETITSLLPALTYAGNSNTVFSLSSPEFDVRGISFSTSSIWVNFYYGRYNSICCSEVWIINDIGGGGTRLSGQGDFSISPSAVPIPAALPLLAAGLSAMGFMGWRRKRKLA